MVNSGSIYGYRDSEQSQGSLASANAFVTALSLTADFNFSLSGTWSGIVTIQRSFDNGGTWLDVASYSSNIETSGFEPEVAVLYRAGFKTGNYTSGTAVVRLSQ